MQVPRFTARQWFWSLTAACFIWAYAGTRTQSASGSIIQSTQDVFVWPVQTVLVPASWIARNVQGAIAWGIRSITTTHEETQSLASLEQQLQQDEMDIATRDGQIAELNSRIDVLKGQRVNGFEPGDLVTANITGGSPGAGSDTIQISKGTGDHIAVGMPVIAGGNHIIGVVASAGFNVSSVRLITDPNSYIKARIVRHVPGGTQIVLDEKDFCLVQGLGNGGIGSTTIKIESAAILKGDIVQLVDEKWPAKLKYFTLGVVSSVGPNANQPLRYEVHARANINEINSVDVLTRW